MIKIENTEVWGFNGALRGMRQPYKSTSKSDSNYCIGENNCCDCYYGDSEDSGDCPTEENCYFFAIGKKDMELCKKLIKAGSEHRKFLRMIHVQADVTAPLSFWKQFSTYKVGTTENSESTMHTITKKEFEINDFSNDSFYSFSEKPQIKKIPIIVEKEEWRPIKDIPHAFVSNSGKVKVEAREIKRSDDRISKLKEREIAVTYSDNDYGRVKLRIDNVVYTRKIHRLMGEAFIPNPENKPYINHKDGNKQNNNLSNLEWVSVSENAQHSQDNKLCFWNEESRKAISDKSRIFHDNEIIEILKLRLEGEQIQNIAKKFETSNSIISRICNGQYFSKTKTPLDCLNEIIEQLNELRYLYLKTNNKKYWRIIIDLLPSSYNQKRTIDLNYETLMNIYHQRKNHKLSEWQVLCKYIESLPYMKEFLEVEK